MTPERIKFINDTLNNIDHDHARRPGITGKELRAIKWEFVNSLTDKEEHEMAYSWVVNQ